MSFNHMPRVSSVESTSSNGSAMDVSDRHAQPATPPTSPRTASRRSKVYHPVVSSMVFSNTLQDCSQINDMLRNCMNHDAGENTSFMCETAMRYQAFCSNSPAVRK